MSETDDTDDLLLIPPDFFVIDSESELDKQSEVPYFSVFDSIITQVNKLSKRLDFIEYTSDLSLANTSVDNLELEDEYFPSPMYNSPKPIHSEYIPYLQRETDSAQSTPQKPRTKFKLNSLPSSPNGGRYSPRRSRTSLFVPKAVDGHSRGDYKQVRSADEAISKITNERGEQQENNLILGEIDHFISNVRTIQRLNADRDRNLTDAKSKTPEPKEREQNALEGVQKRKAWRCGDDISTVPDYGTGMRTAMHTDLPQTVTKTEDPFVQQNLPTINACPSEQASMPANSDSFYTDDISLSSSDSTQATTLQNIKHTDGLKKAASSEVIHSNALRALDLHRKLLSRSVSPQPQQESQNVRKDYGKSSDRSSSYTAVNVNESVEYVPPRIDDLRLFSLKDLWGSKNLKKTGDSDYVLRLEEERLRRQVCNSSMDIFSVSRICVQNGNGF